MQFNFKSGLTAVAFITAVAAIAETAQAETVEGRFYGSVSRQPISGVQVEVVKAGKVYTAESDSRGVLLIDLPPGLYTFNIKHATHYFVQKVVSVEPGIVTYVNYMLDPYPG